MFASGEVTGYAIQSDDKNLKETGEPENKQNHGVFPVKQYYDGLLNSASSPEVDSYHHQPAYDHGVSQHGYSFDAHSSSGITKNCLIVIVCASDTLLTHVYYFKQIQSLQKK